MLTVTNYSIHTKKMHLITDLNYNYNFLRFVIKKLKKKIIFVPEMLTLHKNVLGKFSKKIAGLKKRSERTN